jgi:hypothetical protein
MSQADLAHLLPAARAIAVRSDAERITYVCTERWIDYPAAGELFAEMQSVVEQPPRARMRNVLIVAPSGMGKSMLLEQFKQFNLGSSTRLMSVQKKPLLYVQMPPVPKYAAFFREVLENLGAPVPATHTASKLEEIAIRLLRECSTRTLIVDEINSVLAVSPLQQRACLQLLRFLSNKLSMALICAGTPEARLALMSEPQLRSRFAEFELPRWQDDQALRVFLAHLVQGLPLRRPSPVDSAALRKMVLERSAGLTTTICYVYERAAVAAIESGREMLDCASIEDPKIWRGITQHASGGGRAAG